MTDRASPIMRQHRLILPEEVVRERVNAEIDKVVRSRDRQRRYRNRAHSGSDTSRRGLSEWSPTKGNADAVVLGDLPALRDHARDLDRNSAIAKGVISTKVLNVVGSGFTMIPELDLDILNLTPDQAAEISSQVQAEWKLFTTHECDIERVSTFNQLCAIAYRSQKRDGDCLALMPNLSRPGSPYTTRVQLIESDRISNPDWMPDTPEISGGVRRNPHTGQVMGYYISDQHPNNHYGSGIVNWSYVPAFGRKTGVRNALHLFGKERIGQSRGLPDLTPVIEVLKQLSRLTEAELMASVLASFFTVFVKTEQGDQTLAPQTPLDEIGGSTADADYKLGMGAIVGLADGESIETAEPGRPNSKLDPFFTMILREVGMGVNVPYEILIKHFNASYSASRAAMLEAWRYFSSERSEFTGDFNQPVYERFFFEGVARGRIDAPGFALGDPLIMYAYTRARWVGPPRGMIDETKEVEAAKSRVEAGFSTHENETAALVGGSWRRNMERRAEEEALKEELGLKPEPPPAEPEGGEGKQLPPPDEDDDDGKEGQDDE